MILMLMNRFFKAVYYIPCQAPLSSRNILLHDLPTDQWAMRAANRISKEHILLSKFMNLIVDNPAPHLVDGSPAYIIRSLLDARHWGRESQYLMEVLGATSGHSGPKVD